MPTYEYKCDACGHRFEKFQSMSSAPVRKCPKCGKSRVQRLIGTGAGLIFRGSGFYITDYRDSSYSDKAKAEAGGDKKPETKSESTSETKSETKAESKTESKTESKSESKVESKSADKSAAKQETKSASKSARKK